MKIPVILTLLSFTLSTPVFATCRMPSGKTSDGTLGAAEMLPECGPNGQDPSETSTSVAKQEIHLESPADKTGKIQLTQDKLKH